MNELCLGSACEIARALRAKEVSTVEVVEIHLRRIEAVNPILNAVVTLAAERAMDEARAADARRAGGGPIGPLHGVPVSIKDSIETAGVLTTAGTEGSRATRRSRMRRWSPGCAKPARSCSARPTPRS